MKREKFHRVKEIATYLTEVSMDTGYDYEFLCRMVDELVADGEDINDAVYHVEEVSIERDW